MLFLHRDNHLIFLLYSVNVVCEIDCFSCIQPSLYSRNKTHLVMLGCFQDAIECSFHYFDEYFCISIHQRCLSVIFFYCSIFFQLWDHGNTGLIKFDWECASPLIFWKNIKRIGNFLFNMLVELSREAIWSQVFLCCEVFDY